MYPDVIISKKDLIVFFLSLLPLIALFIMGNISTLGDKGNKVLFLGAFLIPLLVPFFYIRKKVFKTYSKIKNKDNREHVLWWTNLRYSSVIWGTIIFLIYLFWNYFN
jgi:hypothetical protein